MDGFTSAPIPTGNKRGRPALPNPFVDRFPTPEGECVQKVVPGLSDSPEIKRLTRQARQAARDKGLTAHVQVDFDPSEDSEEGELTRFSAWTSPKPAPRANPNKDHYGDGEPMYLPGGSDPEDIPS